MIIDAWFPHFGGGQVHAWELSRQLVLNHGCEIDIVTRALRDEHGVPFVDHETHCDGRLRVWRLGPPRQFEVIRARLGFLARASVWLTRRRFDLIHAHAFLPGLPAKIARAINGTPVVFTVHGTSLFTPKPVELRPSLERRLEQWLLLRARYDHLITVAENFRALPNRNEHITVIPNGVDLTRFEPPRRWPSEFQLLYVGRFDPIKGVHVLIEAMEELKRRGRVPPLKLIGFGPQESLLRKLVQQYKLEGQVQFAGKVTDQALVEAYGDCSLFVLPSLSEGQPLTLLEAWAARRPVLATAVGDNSAYVRDGENGFLVPPGDPVALADAIERATARSDLSAMGERGHELVGERFSWERVADETFTIYDECLARHRAAAVPVRPKPPVAAPRAAAPLKVGMVLDAWFPHVGGGQVHAWELAKRLVLNHGCEVDIVTRALCDEQNVPYTDNESHLNGRLRVWRLGAARHFEAATARVAFLVHATRWLLRHKPDLIHAHTFLPAIPAKLARIFRRIPLVYTVHVTTLHLPPPPAARARLERRLEGWLLGWRYDHVISVANFFRQYLHPGQPVDIIYNGVDLSTFAKTQPWPEQFRLLYVGRFHPTKGLHVLLDALAELKQRGRAVPLKLIGFGPEETRLKEQAQRLGLNSQVEFSPRLSGPVLAQAYGQCSLFVLPSFTEGQPLTLLEAWATGRPVLATNVADNALYIREGENGFLVPPGDPVALAEAIERAMARSDLSAMGERGHELVRERFSWKRVADETFTIYNACLARHRAAVVAPRPKPAPATAAGVAPHGAPSLKITMVVDAWFPHVGGGQVQVWELSKRLVFNHGCEIDIVTRALRDEQGVVYADNESHLDGRLRVWRLGTPLAFEVMSGRLAYLAHATRWLLRHKADLIYAQTFLPAIPAKIARFLRRVPVVYNVQLASLHLPSPPGFRARVERWMEGWLLRWRYDHVVSVANFYRPYFKPGQPVEIIYNAVDVANFAQPQPWPARFQLLYVGRFHPTKGLHILLEALAELNRRGHPVPLRLIGFGPEEARLKEQAQRLGLNSQVEFTPRLTGPALVQAYGQCSLFVLPSFTEGQPLTVLEAWAARRPVLATTVADNALYIRPGENGFLVPPGDVKALADAIEQVMARTDLPQIGQRGYDLVRESFGWDSVAARTFAIYNQHCAKFPQ